MTEPEPSTINVRTPKQILHFSDGVLEIFDDDEETKPEEIVEPEINEVSKEIKCLINNVQQTDSMVFTGI